MTIEVQLDEIEAAFRRRRIGRFSTTVLLWLAALPEWTDQRATAVGFPPDGETLSVLLSRLDAAGLLARRLDVDVDGDLLTAFWLPASRRAEVGSHLRAQLTSTALAVELGGLAARLRDLPRAQLAQVVPWLRVATGHVDDPTGLALLAEVEELVGGGRPDAALAVVGAAQALGDLVGEPLVSSARRARWRIDRAHRQALDARTVRHYLPHPHVDAALRDLIRGGSSTWAVHLLGDGGVGKTMAVRDLASGGLASRSYLPEPVVARIDFDHLDPRYPYGRPGELLLALIGELFTYSATREAESAFRASDDALATLHEAVAARPGTPGDRLLDDAVDAFADYLNDLGAVVVLVLDTCEELAKLHPPGGRAPAVDQTFALLERLHERAPRMRVVLAGRRRLVPGEDGHPPGGLVLDPRPYLNVVALRGFDEAQSRAYLDRRDPDRRLRPALREALLARCTPADGTGAVPYDLACYCDWALAEPGLDPRTLREAPGDPYVEQRILARLPSSAVRDALAVAVELGRFDRPMIEATVTRRGVDVDAAFAGLASQEWVTVATFDDAGLPRVVEVDAGLRPRLRAVLAAHPERFPLDRAALGRDLHALVTRPVAEAPAVEAVEAALRLLPVADAGVMWQTLEDRIAASESGWDWAVQATTRAAAVEALRAAAGGPTVQAAILATQAAAQLRLPGRVRPGPLWAQVLALAPRHPDPAAARRLEFRARCGQLEQGSGRPAAVTRIGAMWAESNARLPLDSLLTALEAADDHIGVELVPADDVLAGQPADVVGAFQLVRAWALMSRDELDPAGVAVDDALALADAEPSGSSRGRPDWVPPGRPRDRARLARTVLAVVRGEPLGGLPLADWRAEALAHLDDIDAERLAAATLTAELAWGVPERDAVAAAAASDLYRPERVPTHPWHRVVPPLCLAVSRAFAALGEAPHAAQWLRDRREEAVATGEDPHTVRLCDDELADLARVFRSLSFTTAVERDVRAGAASAAGWAALALVRGRSPARSVQTTGVHAWWRTQVVVDAAVTDRLRMLVLGDSARPLDAAEALDLVEAARLEDTVTPGAARDACARLLARPPRPVLAGADTLGAVLRAEALLDPAPDVDAVVAQWPPRLVGEIAMAEGELLALRLPARALTLLNRAVAAFRAADDASAAARATVLRRLVAARVGSPVAEGVDDPVLEVVDLPDQPDWSGWPTRLSSALRLGAGSRDDGPWPVDPSPELAPPPAPSLPSTAPEPAPSSAGPALTAGTRFGPYRLEVLLRHDRTCEVHRAHHTDLERRVTLTVLSGGVSEDAAFAARFRRTAARAARISSPSLLPIHDVGKADGRLFVACRFVEGVYLDRLLAERGPLPLQQVVRIVTAVAGALDAVHAAGLVVRDVEAARVLVTPDGPVYLTDVGLVADSAEAGFVDDVVPIDHPGNLAPERLSGTALDHRTDVYGLACLLYETLAGAPPFVGLSAADLLAAHLQWEPPAPSQVRPELSTALDAVVARGMAKDPDRRHASAGEFAAAVQAALGAASRSTTTMSVPRPRATFSEGRVTGGEPPAGAGTGSPAPARSRWYLWIGGLVGGVLAAAALGVASVRSSPGVPDPAVQVSPFMVVLPMLVVLTMLVLVLVLDLVWRRGRRTPGAGPTVTPATPSEPSRPTTAAVASHYGVAVGLNFLVLTPDPGASSTRSYRLTLMADVGSTIEYVPRDEVVVVVPVPPLGRSLRWQLPYGVREHDRTRLDFRGPAQMRPASAFPSGLPALGLPACRYVVGTAVSTSAGWRLRVRDAEPSSSDPYGPPSSSGSSSYGERGWSQQARGQFEGERLLGPDDLLPSHTVLIVLQTEPGVGTRLAAQSLQGMRALAAELRDGGAGAVLVVPSLPDRLAGFVVDTIAGTMQRERDALQPVVLLDLVHEVHTRVVATSPDQRVLFYVPAHQERKP